MVIQLPPCFVLKGISSLWYLSCKSLKLRWRHQNLSITCLGLTFAFIHSLSSFDEEALLFPSLVFYILVETCSISTALFNHRNYFMGLQPLICLLYSRRPFLNWIRSWYGCCWPFVLCKIAQLCPSVIFCKWTSFMVSQ